MILFHEALGSAETTGSFKVTALNANYPVNVVTIGTFNAQTIKIAQSPDNSTFTDLYADGSLASFSTTGEQRSFVLSPGYYHFVSSSGLTDVDIYVDGRYVTW